MIYHYRIDHLWSVSGRVGFQKVNLRRRFGNVVTSVQGSQLPHNIEEESMKRFYHDDDDGTAFYIDDNGLRFTAEGRRHFTDEERENLERLDLQCFAKFDEICTHLAAKLGHGEPQTLSVELRGQISAEAQDLVDNWSELDMSDDPKDWDKVRAPAPGLQTLLAELHELGEKIMYIQDTAVERDMKGTAD